MFGVQTSSGNLHEMAIASSQAGQVLVQLLSHRQNLDMRTLNTLVKSQTTSKNLAVHTYRVYPLYALSYLQSAVITTCIERTCFVGFGA